MEENGRQGSLFNVFQSEPILESGGFGVRTNALPQGARLAIAAIQMMQHDILVGTRGHERPKSKVIPQ